MLTITVFAFHIVIFTNGISSTNAPGIALLNIQFCLLARLTELPLSARYIF